MRQRVETSSNNFEVTKINALLFCCSVPLMSASSFHAGSAAAGQHVHHVCSGAS